MPSALQIANVFLSLADPDVGDNISNLKLQKLLYYAQGFCLAMHNEPLFEEKILAWEHGPVVEEVYYKFKEYGAQAIPMPENFDDNVISEKHKDLIKEIYQVFGQFSAWKLRNMTHSEKPWMDTQRNNVISHDSMKNYFKDYIVE